MSVKVLGHPVHQMMIVLPMGMLSGAVIFDILAMVARSSEMAITAFYMISGGVLSGLLAAPFGLMDWLSIPPGTRARQIGAVHGIGNVVVLLLFSASWFVRIEDPVVPTTAALALSFGGFLLSLITGWLGGELVDRLGVGVDEGAHVNAPSSLSTPAPARQQVRRRI